MSEHKFTDETATVIVLRNLVDDVEHLLRWLTMAQGCLVLVNVVHFVGSVTDRDWLDAAIDALLAASFVVWAVATNKRHEKYHPARRKR